MMRAAILFSGIGGWEIACERNGVEVAWAAEWDDWKRTRYLERWPSAVLYGDVEALDGRSLVTAHGPLDILLGSPPCTDISAANVGGCGIDGAESRYYLEAIRLARETGARWVGFENSPRLRTRGADRVLTLLDEAGYAIWPCVVAASDAGAPHKRSRSFVIGCRRDAIECADAERARLWLEQGWSRGPRWAGAAEPQTHAHPDGQGRPDGAEHGREVGGCAGIDGDAQSSAHDEASDRTGERRGSRRTGRSDPGVALQQGQQFARRPSATADADSEHWRRRAGRCDGAQVGHGGKPTPCHSASRARSEWRGVGGDPFEKLTAAQRAALCPWDQRGDGLAGYLSMANGLADRLRGHGLSERAVKAELARWRSALGDALVIPVVWSVVRAILRTDAGIVPARINHCNP